MNLCVWFFFPSILKLFYCRIDDTVRFVTLLSFIFSIVTLGKDYFFNLLQWLHEMAGENATRKQEQTALERLGSQGWQGIGQDMNCTLWATSHSSWTGRAGLVMVTAVRPSPVTARLGCSTEAALRPSWVTRIGERLGQAWAELQRSSGRDQG